MRASTFTTYINATIDPGLEAAYARQERVATASYAKITQSALEATRATAGLLGGKGTAGIQTTSRALDDQTRSTRQATAAAADNERQAARTSAALQREAQSAQRAATTHQGLARNLNTTATAFAVVDGRMSPLAGRLLTVSRAAESLTGLQLGLAGVGATLFALGRAGNEYANLASRIRPFYDSQTDANKAMEDIIGIAQRSRTALEPIVELYSRLKSNSDQLGISQSRIGRLTEIASKAATLSGGTRQAREGALVQFSQAVGANFRGSGQEFQSLQEGAPLLLKAIADGYKNVDGSIGTSISNLRKLGQQGDLTSRDVADALERSSVKIDKQFSTLPKTLGVAGTEFGNALTVMVGRFDQSVGLTNTLAEGISVIATNLRVITALALGVATAFAGIKLVGLAEAGAANIASLIAQQAQVKALDAAWVEDSAVTAAAYKARVTELEAERLGIRGSIVEIVRKQEAQAAAAAEAIAQQRAVAAAAAETVVASRYSGFATNPVSGLRQSTTQAQNALEAETAKIYQLQAAAANEAAVAVNALAAAEQRLSATNVELTATAGAATVAEEALEVATANVGARVGLLGGAARNLLALFGGPWGIAFAVAATAVYLLATAETAAEKATRLHEDAQRSFAGIIDKTTGKIYDQVDALQKLDVAQKSKASEQDSRKQFGQSRSQLIELIRNYTRPIDDKQYAALSGDGTPLPASVLNSIRKAPSGGAAQELDRLVSAFENNAPGAYKALTDGVVRLAPKIDGLAKALPNITATGAAVRESYNTNRQARAQQRVLRGTAQAGDVALALGEQPQTSGGAAAKPRTKSQIEAEARARSAQTDVQRAQADLAKIRADGKAATETEDQYIDRLAAAQTAVKNAQQAEKDLRKQRSAGAAEARKELSNEKTEALQAAAAKKNTDLAALYEQGLNPQSAEYKKQRDAILNTYDEEVAKIRGLKNEHTALAAAASADAQATAAYVKKMGETRKEILSNYDETPKAVDTATKRIDKLQDAVGTTFNGVQAATADNPLGRGVYTQEIADADARRITDGVYKPLNDANREAQRGIDIAALQLAGYDQEAEALKRAVGYVDSLGQLREGDYNQILKNVQAEQHVNDLLASRQRITSLLQGTVDDTRQAFTTFLTELPKNAGNATKNLLTNIQQRFAQINAQRITETIFAGTDEKVRALISGKANIDSALRQYVDTLGTTEDASGKLATAMENAAQRIDAATTKLTPTDAGIGSTSVGTNAGNVGAVIANTVAGGSTAAAGVVAIAAAAAGKAATKVAANDNGTAAPAATQDIIVQATRLQKQTAQVLRSSATPSASQLYSTIGKNVGSNLDNVLHGIFGSGKKNADGTFDTSKGGFLGLGNTSAITKLGDKIGGALKGAGTGQLVSGLGNALGLGLSNTGAQIGGAIGSLIPIPGGDIIGSIAGGILGSLFKKPKSGNATIGISQYGELSANAATGNANSAKQASFGLASSVADGLTNIASTLGAKISSAPPITVGTFDGKYRVATTNTTKSLNFNNFNSSQLTDFGQDQQAAITYAIKYSIEHSVLTGISQASINILKSGQDLEKAVTKAGVIESIPKRLQQLTDPVGYAVSTLNTEFSTMIDYLKEGGATAQQFADAQKLYDLERADAIKQATANAASAINDFLKQITAGSDSPYNKATTYQNASSAFNAFQSDVNAGKAVDQNDLLSAAKNFQDASRALNGSGQGFFSDFEAMKALLQKAADNATASVSGSTSLPASPFTTDSTVQAAIASLQGSSAAATQAQTDAVTSKLDQVIDAINQIPGVSVANDNAARSAISALPGFA